MRLLLVLTVLTFAAPAQVRWTGKTGKNLIHNGGYSLCAWRWPDPPASQLPFPIRPGDTVYAGELKLDGQGQRGYRVAAVEPAQGKAIFYIDLDRDGKVSAGERHTFRRLKNDLEFDQEVELKLPVADKHFRWQPVSVRFYRRGKENACTGFQRAVVATTSAYVTAKTKVGGRNLRTAYYYKPGDPSQDLLSVTQAIDANLDGKLEFRPTTPEFTYTWDAPVLRAGSRYLTTERVDLDTRRVVLREHPASEYQRVELTPGTRPPDFAFVDFSGRVRNTSEFRGRYLLVNFWEDGCGPCFAEFPHLAEAQRRFRSRGLEILGVTGTEFSSSLAAVPVQRGAFWTQATRESTEQYARQRIRVYGWPLLYLLDPEGRLVTVDDNPGFALRGEAMLATLDRLLPRAQNALR